MVKAAPKKDRLLEGEDSGTVRPEDAAHWIAIYTEMIFFKTQLLTRVMIGLDAVSDEARKELKEDVDLVEAQLERYERRLEFWSHRAVALEAPKGG
jgi:hypothetical protein